MMATSTASAFSLEKIKNYLKEPVHIAPLVVLRIIFGGVMFASIIRFISKGWVYEQYIAPKIYFPFYCFEWVKPLGATGMYILFSILAISSFFIILGLFYRLSAVTFFLVFTYVELIDKTNYLNHYYFISIIAFLMLWVPAHRYFSIDAYLQPSQRSSCVPRWTIEIFKCQLLIVYFYAGLAKLNPDWLMRAMPLRIWLPAKADLPMFGDLLDQVWVAYFFSWFGAVYDLTVPFFLYMRKTRFVAYFFVIAFHISTAILFPIGMFPYIMILMTLIFFSEDFHKNIIKILQKAFPKKAIHQPSPQLRIVLNKISPFSSKLVTGVLLLHFIIQILLPFRFVLYPDNLFWTEQGYRFSWRVMLMEKAGTAFFYVEDPKTGRKGEIDNSDYLTKNQEKMMATQPDMILQFAHFLEQEYKKMGIEDPVIKVESYVTLNGSGSRSFLNKEIDLTKEKESFSSKKWILPYSN